MNLARSLSLGRFLQKAGALYLLLGVALYPHVVHSAAEPVQESCIDEACFPLEFALPGSRRGSPSGAALRRVGLAKLTWFGLRVYAAALYTPSGSAEPTTLLGPLPKTLIIHYFRSFSAKDFIEGEVNSFRKNPHVSLATIEPARQLMDSLYRPVKKGSRYAISYDPAQGTSLELDGELLGTVPGDEFAAAYFGIWLSDYSVDRSFTSTLRGDIAR